MVFAPKVSVSLGNQLERNPLCPLMDRDSEQTQRGGEARQPAFSALGDSHACKP